MVHQSTVKKRVVNKGEQILIDNIIATGAITTGESFLCGHDQKECSKVHTISNMQLNLYNSTLCRVELLLLLDSIKTFDGLLLLLLLVLHVPLCVEWKVYGSIKCVAMVNVTRVPVLADLNNNTSLLYWQGTQEVKL